MAYKQFICLRGIVYGNRFFTINDPLKDQTKLMDGTIAYTIIGYADSISEAQEILYGRSYPIG